MLHTDIAIVIPVGPGHEEAAERAVDSVRAAWAFHTGNFARLQFVLEHDPDGAGAAKTRNRALEKVRASWVVFLDSDDLFDQKAFFSMMVAQMAFPDAKGMWGLWTEIIKRGWARPRFEGPPWTWDRMVNPPGLAIGMTGMFRVEQCRELWFDERMPRGEGTEFCFAFAANYDVEMINAPIVVVDHTTQSARGPRNQGFRVARTTALLRKRYKERGRVPFTEEEFRERREERAAPKVLEQG